MYKYNSVLLIIFFLTFRLFQVTNEFSALVLNVLVLFLGLSIVFLNARFVMRKAISFDRIFFAWVLIEFLSLVVFFVIQEDNHKIIKLFVWMLLCLFMAISVISSVSNKEELHKYYGLLYYCIALYLLENYVFYALDVHSTNLDKNISDTFGFQNFNNKILNSIGFSESIRVVYPLSSGVKGLFALSTILSVMAFFKFWVLNKKKTLHLLIFSLAFWMAITIEARMSLFLIILSILFIVFFYKNRTYKKNILKYLPFFSPFLVFVLIAIISFSADLLSSWEWLSRDAGIENLYTLSERTIIWAIAWDAYNPNLMQLLFGYGAYGQEPSGLSQGYSHIFDSRNDISIKSLHNIYLQIIVDRGLAGLAIFIMVMFRVLSRLSYSAHKSEELFPYFLFFITMLLLGQLETVPYYSPLDFFTFYIFFTTFSLVKYKSNRVNYA